MSQPPSEPNENNSGNTDPRHPDRADHGQRPVAGPQHPAVTPLGSTGEPTRPIPQHSAADTGSQQPGDDQSTARYPSAAGQYQGQPSPADASGPNPYGASPYPQHQAPLPPERPARKRYAGSTLIAGMVAAALIGGVTAAGTTYLMTPTGSGTAQVQSPREGVVINNPESVTTATAAAAKAAPSVVTIEASGNGSAGSGSGIILDAEGHILTNTHVVTLGGATGDPVLNVRLNDGKVYSATLVGTDPLSDLAVIKVEAENLLPATLGESGNLNVGDTAVAIGAPLGLSGTVTDGIISTLNRTISVASSAVPEQQAEGNGGGSDFQFEFPGMPQGQSNAESIYINVIQTDAAINHGNSGGALVNAAGEIIGVNVAIASSGDEDSGSIGVGFAIPIDYAKRIANELISNGKASHGLLGATVQAFAATSGANQSTGFSTGARIVEVNPGSAAEKAGFVAGDVITGVNGRPILDSQTLTAAIREVAAGGQAQITYLREEQSHTVDVTVGTLE
ncbi:trypsin-like peptidase domain-containing protein [Glutamicibacter sp. MNS18]|uniref:S1C family serine protease n=1 Tax=Glutamicibacter sp. MNS18 TaxID=2989817 RepID=UPI002235AE7A|nr:trypsin-like peptidase domain-containing protein [Glutamicibacter sp. MNS18]MCW4464372.1 trypsin-like peptidase domain-containing protein [Glutamicibacter sp. MNS18]